ncbi:acetolactate synthase large subunit, partial [candidate division KSB1 bacterium]
MPMLMITGQKPIKKSKQARFQIIDVVDMMKPITKYTHQIVNGNNIPSRIREAFRIAEEERPGAVHLELPEDIADEETNAVPFSRSHNRRPIAEEKAIAIAVEMIEKAEHPLLLVGAGANRKRTSKMLTEFIDKTGIPFVCTQMGKGVIDERHKLYIGNAALSADDYLHGGIEWADLIINVGHDVVEKPPFFMNKGGFKVIHVNFSSADVDPVYFPQVEVVGDIANSIWQIKEKIKAQKKWDFSYFMRIKEGDDYRTGMSEKDDSFPIKPGKLISDMRKVIPSDGIVALDNGVYKLWFAKNYKAYEPNTVILDNALASMGAGMPSAMAAKIVYPDRKVISVCGDGGFMMNSQELETSVRYGLDLVVIILRDDAFGMIKWKQEAMGFESFGLDIGNPDFTKYAESYGAHGHRLESTIEFEALLKECINCSGVQLIDIPIDYSDNARFLTG